MIKITKIEREKYEVIKELNEPHYMKMRIGIIQNIAINHKTFAYFHTYKTTEGLMDYSCLKLKELQKISKFIEEHNGSLKKVNQVNPNK